MMIHLKRNEKLYLNGAVIKLDRRGTIELLNDANFLLESHILQPEQAITPLRQVYFVIQMMLMDPPNAGLMMELFRLNLVQLRQLDKTESLNRDIEIMETLVEQRSYYEAMKRIRACYHLETIRQATQTEITSENMEAA
jgi:flagellar biosynthesis repressor protein FlbT